MVSKYKYKLLQPIRYWSKRYQKWIKLPVGYLSDGATGAIDIDGPIRCERLEDNNVVYTSMAWWVHDKLCDTGVFEDGTPCTNWQASQVLQDILYKEGRYVRAHRWFWATWLFGGDKARENGMI